ncbi:MAG: hypothetical protein ACLSA6_15165 [Holdemania massiliensis]
MELKQTPEGWSSGHRNQPASILSLFEAAERVKTSGVAGFLLHQFHQPLRFSVALSIALWTFIPIARSGGCQRYRSCLQRQIEQQLADNGYAVPFLRRIRIWPKRLNF